METYEKVDEPTPSRGPSVPHTAWAGRKPIHIGSFSDESGYAINLAAPRGVFYLQRRAFKRLREILAQYGNPPSVKGEPFEDEIGKRLVREIIGEDNPVAIAKKRVMSVWLHISNSCNLACSYCYIPHLKKGVQFPVSGTIASKESVDRIVRELIALCLNQKFEEVYIRFAGGEPSLATGVIRQACDEFVRVCAANNVGIGFGMHTNGTIVNAEMIHLLHDYKFSGVTVSIDGGKEDHDRYRFRIERTDRPVKVGTWTEITGNVDTLICAGVQPFILCTLTAENIRSVEQLVEFCISRKIGFRLSPVRDRRTANIPGIQGEFLERLVSIYNRLAKTLPIDRPIERFANFAEWSPQQGKTVACGTCKNSLAISESGEVSTCQMRLERTYGNVRTNPLPVIFNEMVRAEHNARFLSLPSDNSGCSQCLWRTTCAGGCPEHTMLAFKTYDRPSPWCELYGNFLPHYFRSIAMQIKAAVE